MLIDTHDATAAWYEGVISSASCQNAISALAVTKKSLSI